MAKKYTGLNLSRVQVPTTIDTTGLGKGILEAEKFKYEEKEAKRKEALEFLKPEATFRPYQQSANKLLTDALAKMSKSETYDPAEYAKVAADYSELINLGNAFETNLKQVSNALMQDPEVNSDLAIPSLYNQYIKTGTADELRQNANKPIDPGEMIGSLGGSKLLKQDVVLSNRLKTIGEITRAVASQGKWQEIFPGLAEAAAIQEITQAASIVDIDTKGNPYIKDINSPVATTALKVMLTENRVARIVDDSLNAKGIQQPTPDERVEELRKLLAPYADYTTKKETKTQTSRFATTSSSGDGGGGGSQYISLWMQDLTSGDPQKEKQALAYIRAGEKLNIAALPTDAVNVAISKETIKPTLWKKYITGSAPLSLLTIDQKNRDSLIQDLSDTGEITASEIVVGQSAFGQDPNQKYLKLKLKAGNPILTSPLFDEFYDVYVPINTLKDSSQSMPLYKSAYEAMGAHYGVHPGTMNINQLYAPTPFALGGEIDVDTKFSDFQGTETVKDLIGGFAKGGDIGMSVFDLIKKTI